MTQILDWKTGQFRPLNRDEKKSEERMLARLKEQREWKLRARSIEKIAVEDPNIETIGNAIKAFADWQEYGRPSSRSAAIAADLRKLARDEGHCARLVCLWKKYKEIKDSAGLVYGMTRPWYFDHERNET